MGLECVWIYSEGLTTSQPFQPRIGDNLKGFSSILISVLSRCCLAFDELAKLRLKIQISPRPTTFQGQSPW